MNISSFITSTIVFTVITSALVSVGQERAIASYGKTLSEDSLETLKDEYRQNLTSGKIRIQKSSINGKNAQERANFAKFWKKSGHEGSAWLGSWSADQGLARINIYPSSTKSNRVCIVILTEDIEYHPGHVNRGAVYLDDGSLMFPEKGKLVHARYPGPRFNQLVPDSQALPKQYDRSNLPSVISRTRQSVDSLLENEGCTSELPIARSSSVDRSADLIALSNEDLAVQKFRQQIRQIENDSNRSRYIRDRRSAEVNSEYSSFVQKWSTVDSVASNFLGGWGGWEDTIWMYPSNEKGKICVVTTEIDYANFATGRLDGSRLRLSDGRTVFREGKYVGVIINRDGKSILADAVVPNHSPVPLSNISKLLRSNTSRQSIMQQFESEGCTTGLPEGTIAKPIEQLQPIATRSNYAYPTADEFTAFRKTVKANNTISGTDRSTWDQYHQIWQSKNDAIAPYIGAWKTADNTLLYVYPSPQKGRFCVVTKENGKLSTGKGLGYRREARYNGDFGLFKIEGLADVVAMRSDAGQPLVPLYAAIDEPELSADLREELETLKCVVELPKGVTSMKPLGIRKPYPGDRVRESPSR